MIYVCAISHYDLNFDARFSSPRHFILTWSLINALHSQYQHVCDQQAIYVRFIFNLYEDAHDGYHDDDRDDHDDEDHVHDHVTNERVLNIYTTLITHDLPKLLLLKNVDLVMAEINVSAYYFLLFEY